MAIFDIPTPETLAAKLLADGFLAEANQQFESTLQGVYDSVQRFWYRNRDEKGEPALEGEEPSGIEILQAMGPHAKAAIDVAYARVVMLMTIQAGLGINVVDLSRCAAPYELKFNAGGSLASWSLRQQGGE